MGKFDAPAAEQPYVIEDLEGLSLCRIRTLKYSASKSDAPHPELGGLRGRLLRLPKDALPEPDVVVVSSLSLLTVLNGLRLRRRYRCRLVFEVRDIWPLTSTRKVASAPATPLCSGLGAVERLGYRRADAIVGTMPNLGEHVEKVTGSAAPNLLHTDGCGH